MFRTDALRTGGRCAAPYRGPGALQAQAPKDHGEPLALPLEVA